MPLWFSSWLISWFFELKFNHLNVFTNYCDSILCYMLPFCFLFGPLLRPLQSHLVFCFVCIIISNFRSCFLHLFLSVPLPFMVCALLRFVFVEPFFSSLGLIMSNMMWIDDFVYVFFFLSNVIMKRDATVLGAQIELWDRCVI